MKYFQHPGLSAKSSKGELAPCSPRRAANHRAGRHFTVALTVVCLVSIRSNAADNEPGLLRRLGYNHPGLVVDLGVGLWAWPLPMDYDRDGDMDLVVSCPDVPYSGVYLFENRDGAVTMPVFQPAQRIGDARRNIQVSYVEEIPRVLTPGTEYVGFLDHHLGQPKDLPLAADFHEGKVRANQWKYADFDGDGQLDLLIGIGDWFEYGWDNAFSDQGEWTRGPLRGYVYWARNTGTNHEPRYAEPRKLAAGEQLVDVYGMPSPNLADFDSDGDLDLLCGEFVDKFTYFENQGTRTEPKFAKGRRLMSNGQPLQMDLCMIVPVAVDWDGDGDEDLVVGQEDGRVALIEHTGTVVDGLPQFEPPRFFQQMADSLKFGALVTPASRDWDGDGDEDLICGNTAGRIGFIENLDGGDPPKWAAPQRLQADGEEIRIMAGENGSIQGPCEAKWGYTTLSVADWDHDGLKDLLVNSIWGKVVWYRNIGATGSPKLAAQQPVEVAWSGEPRKPAWFWWDPKGDALATQWRTTPVVLDFNGDGLNDLVMLDHEGYLSLFERSRRDGQLELSPPRRVFTEETGEPLRLTDGRAGKSGRRKFHFADWDQDGQIDLLVNSGNVLFLQGVRSDKETYRVHNRGDVDARRLAGHTTSPTTVDWDQNGVPDLLVGAEDGFFYYLRNPRSATHDHGSP